MLIYVHDLNVKMYVESSTIYLGQMFGTKCLSFAWSSHPEESSFWLPLYGNVCCRLVAQPSCMARDMMAGFLHQQVRRPCFCLHPFLLIAVTKSQLLKHLLLPEVVS